MKSWWVVGIVAGLGILGSGCGGGGSTAERRTDDGATGISVGDVGANPAVDEGSGDKGTGDVGGASARDEGAEPDVERMADDGVDEGAGVPVDEGADTATDESTDEGSCDACGASGPFRDVSWRRGEIARFDTLEISFSLATAYANPFDPAEVDVRGRFHAPEGPTREVVCFWYQAYVRSREGDAQVLAADGDPHWRCRFAPDVSGSWSFELSVTDSSGTETWSDPAAAFDVVDGSSGGFVRVSDEDPHRFADDLGRAVFPIGVNMGWAAWGPATYEFDEWVPALAAQGGDVIRMWTAPWSTAIEWTDTGLGDYTERLDEAWELDYIFDLCEAHGVRIILNLYSHGEFSSEVNPHWKDNPYNAINGGPLADPSDVWTDPDARAFMHRNWRYLIARYGHSTSLLTWELFNEMEFIDDYDEHINEIGEWHRDAASWFGAHDPYGHLLCTALARTPGKPEIFGSGIDILQTHSYRTPDLAQTAADTTAWMRDLYPGVPYLLGELGTDVKGAANIAVDPTGVHIHNGQWASLMSGAAGGGYPWWWNSYIHPQDLWFRFRGISSFVANEALHERGYEPTMVRVESAASGSMEIEPELTWDERMPSPTHTVSREGAVHPGASGLRSFVYGSWHSERGEAPTFDVDVQHPGSFEIVVGAVGTGESGVTISVDGEVALVEALPAQADFANPVVLAVPLEPGRHTVTVTNHLKGWARVDVVRFKDTLAALRAYALQSPHRVLGWVQSRHHIWSKLGGTDTRPRVDDAVLHFDGLTPGVWRVEWWDTLTGEVIGEGRIEASPRGAALPVPELDTDVAFKLILEQSASLRDLKDRIATLERTVA